MPNDDDHQPPDDPVLHAAAQAVHNTIELLGEAREYLRKGERLCAIGTLIMFDDHAEDVRAALRIIRMQRRPS